MKLMPARVSFRFFVPARNFMPAWKCSNFVKFSMWTEFFSFRGETNSLNSISGLTIWRAKSVLDFFLSWILASLFFGFVYLNWNGWSGSPNENSGHEKTVSKIVLCLIYMLVVVLDRTILPVIISSFCCSEYGAIWWEDNKQEMQRTRKHNLLINSCRFENVHVNRRQISRPEMNSCRHEFHAGTKTLMWRGS